MKKIACILFSILLCAVSTAQKVGVKDFKWLSSGDVTVKDSQTGKNCALIYIQTPKTGWTFEAGSGTWIEYVRQEKGVIYLYLSADVRTLSFSLPGYSPLKDWFIPVTLEAGDTYTLTLTPGSYTLPTSGNRSYAAGTSSVASTSSSASSEKSSYSNSSSSSASSVSSLISSSRSSSSASKSSSNSYSSSSESSSPSATSSQSSTTASSGRAVRASSSVYSIEDSFSTFFLDMYGSVVHSQQDVDTNSWSYYDEDCFVGLRFTYLPNRVGFYASAAYSYEESWSAFAGTAFRLTSEDNSNLDLHLYAGGGLVDGEVGAGELGLRFGWKGHGKMSLCDLSVGCQFFDHCIAPTVSVGFAIWGVPVAIGVCIVAGVVMSAL